MHLNVSITCCESKHGAYRTFQVPHIGVHTALKEVPHIGVHTALKQIPYTDVHTALKEVANTGVHTALKQIPCIARLCTFITNRKRQ